MGNVIYVYSLPQFFLSIGDFVTEKGASVRYTITIRKTDSISGIHRIISEKGWFSMAVIHVTKENFETEVLQSEKKVLIDFWASWCGPCRMVSPIIDEIAEEQDAVKVCKVNVDEQPELAQAFGVMSIPTLAVVEGGKVVEQAVGARPKADILALIS